MDGVGHTEVGRVVMQGWGGGGHAEMGWGRSCRDGVGWVMQRLDGVGHAGVGWGGSCRGGVGWVMQG